VSDVAERSWDFGATLQPCFVEFFSSGVAVVSVKSETSVFFPLALDSRPGVRDYDIYRSCASTPMEGNAFASHTELLPASLAAEARCPDYRFSPVLYPLPHNRRGSSCV